MPPLCTNKQTKAVVTLAAGVILQICLFSASSPHLSTAAACVEMPKSSLRSPETLEGAFLHMQLKPGPPKKTPRAMNLCFYDTQKNKNSEIMITGRIISLQVNKNRTKCFTSAAAFRGISMRMCGQCFNAAQLTARERGWRARHWAGPPLPDVPPCCPNNTRGCLRI